MVFPTNTSVISTATALVIVTLAISSTSRCGPGCSIPAYTVVPIPSPIVVKPPTFVSSVNVDAAPAAANEVPLLPLSIPEPLFKIKSSVPPPPPVKAFRRSTITPLVAAVASRVKLSAILSSNSENS